jgi:thymidylate synthase (FAD)
VLDKEFYIPAPDHLAAQSTSNRQGRGAVLTGEEASQVLALLQEDAARNYDHYLWMLNEGDGASAEPDRTGLARELARMNLTLNAYTQWYWKTDLHNLFNFLRLRADAHAQYEIRAYAEAMLAIAQRWVPLSYEAFEEYRLGSVTLSRTALSAVKRMMAGEPVTQATSGLSPGEWREFLAVFPSRG